MHTLYQNERQNKKWMRNKTSAKIEKINIKTVAVCAHAFVVSEECVHLVTIFMKRQIHCDPCK